MLVLHPDPVQNEHPEPRMWLRPSQKKIKVSRFDVLLKVANYQGPVFFRTITTPRQLYRGPAALCNVAASLPNWTTSHDQPCP
jgi:hypothetical protein